MLKPVTKMSEETNEKQLFIVPESDLEERFILWFAYENSVPRQRVNNKEALMFHHMSDPEMLQHNVTKAFENYKIRFNYVEIPYLIGVSLARAREELHMRGLQWAIEREVDTTEFPPEFIIGQNPLKEAVVAPQSVVYLTVSKKTTSEDE
jgi:hypothetical protein